MLCQCFLFTLYILKKNKPNHPSPGNTELSHPLVTGKKTFTELINFPPKCTIFTTDPRLITDYTLLKQ